MNDHGFILDDDFAIEDQKMSPTESFENIYKNMIHNGMRNNKINMTDDEKTISFLNKCFVFKKVNNMVKSYTSDEDDNQKKLLSVGFPKKTAEAVILQQL